MVIIISRIIDAIKSKSFDYSKEQSEIS